MSLWGKRKLSPVKMFYDRGPIVQGRIVLHINVTYLLSFNVPMTQDKNLSGQNDLWQKTQLSQIHTKRVFLITFLWPRPNCPTYKYNLFAKFKWPYKKRKFSPVKTIHDQGPIVPGPIVLHINITYLLILNVPMTQEKIISGHNDLWPIVPDPRPNCHTPKGPIVPDINITHVLSLITSSSITDF